MKRKDYYNLLPTEIKEKAIANTDKNSLNSNINNIHEAIAGGFFWDTSPEGDKYWMNVYEIIDSMYVKLEQMGKLENEPQNILQ